MAKQLGITSAGAEGPSIMLIVHRAGGLILLGLSFGIAVLAGCGGETDDGPPTVPVSGKVVFTKGGKVSYFADSSGAIEFESLDQPGVRAVGAITEDGSFNMGTRTEQGGKPGAIAGKHRVRIILDEDAKGVVAPKFLSFSTSGISVTVPSDKPLEIEVWK
jgi:hypothetical protein